MKLQELHHRASSCTSVLHTLWINWQNKFGCFSLMLKPALVPNISNRFINLVLRFSFASWLYAVFVKYMFDVLCPIGFSFTYMTFRMLLVPKLTIKSGGHEHKMDSQPQKVLNLIWKHHAAGDAKCDHTGQVELTAVSKALRYGDYITDVMLSCFNY